jgi:hypothetical protein
MVSLSFAGAYGSAGAYAQSTVTVHVNTNGTGRAIPADFAGLSFESANLIPDKNGMYLFTDRNKDLINLFRTIGIKNLRVGGGTADGPEFAIPRPADIDQLFAFAKAADVRVIYTLRLLNGNVEADAEIASYIAQHYSDRLECFQIGNEPDWHSFHTSPGHMRDPRIEEATPEIPGSAYPSFLATWRQFASAIDARVPGAKYTGPDTGSNYPVPGTKNTDFDGESWTQRFAEDEKSSGRLQFVAQHDYVGESAVGVSVPTAVAAMLSRNWVEKMYPLLFDHVLGPVEKEGLSYRMTEANDYTGGIDGASNAYVSALWTLDYLHWHAEHGAVGINFHNKKWIFTDTVYVDSGGAYRFNPKAYGIRAFELGSEGNAIPVSVTDNPGVNLTAYAVKGTNALFVTLINKEYGASARKATVNIIANDTVGRARGMYLESPGGDVTAKAGITLGGAPISTEEWNGKWTDLAPVKNGQVWVTVPSASALVLSLNLKQAARP